MTLTFSLQTLFEVFLVVALFWGIFHEDRLIAFEKRIVSALRRRKLRVVGADTRCRVSDSRQSF